VKEVGDYIPMGDGTKLLPSQLLQMFQFPPEMQYTYVSKLSGGEKKRLYLLTVLMKNPNFLILDEPTNDLDLITLSTLEQFLLDFPGCLIMVSHDRYFMDKLADELFILEGNGVVKNFIGSYTEYREQEKENKKRLNNDSSDSKITMSKDKNQSNQENQKNHSTDGVKLKMSNKERFEFQGLDKDIAKLEKQKAELTEKMVSGITDHNELADIAKKLGEVTQLLDEKQLRWLELSEMVE
jgi:ATP-binding cassette subfamily F protein uup